MTHPRNLDLRIATMKKKGNMGTTGSSSVSSKVTNRSNTGAAMSDIQTSGATGNQVNTVTGTTIHGTPGAPGRADPVTINDSSDVNAGYTLPNVPLPPNYQAGPDPTINVFDQANTHITNAFDQADAAISRLPAEHQAGARAQVAAARTRTMDQLSGARTRINDARSRAAALRRQYGD